MAAAGPADRYWRAHRGALLIAGTLLAAAFATETARAEDLRAELETLAAEHGFQVKGLDKVARAPAVGAGGALRARLAVLLAGYDHVLEGRPPSVARIIILGAKSKPADAVAVPTTRRGAQHMVRVRLRGNRGRQHALSLMVDTGASTLVLPASLIDTLGFRGRDLREITSRTANGYVTGRSARLEEVAVGDAVARDVEVTFIADDTLGGVRLLGMSFLDNFALTIDQRGNRLLLGPR